MNSNGLYRFLMAKLHLRSVAGELRLGTVRSTLKALPSELNDIYYIPMQRIRDGQQRSRSNLAMRMLMLLSHGLQPMRPDSVQHALLTMEVKQGETNIDRNDLYPKELLISICGGLVALEDGTSIVRFMHHTVETYFESRRETLFIDAQAELTKVCVTYLLFDEFGSGVCETEWDLNKRLQSNPFYAYAAKNWGSHASAATTLDCIVIHFIQCKMNVEASCQILFSGNWLCFDECGTFIQERTSGLYLAAYFGLYEAVNALIKRNHSPISEDIFDNTPLSYAIKMGHSNIVNLLFNEGAGSESTGLWGRSALSVAITSNRIDMVKLLLDQGADLEVQNIFGYSALYEAIYSARNDIVRLLLDKGAKYNYVTIFGDTAITLAAQFGRISIFKLLLDKGADPWLKDSYRSSTALAQALEHGHKAIVRLLLDMGADLKLRYGFIDETALTIAARTGGIGVFRLLLEKEVDIECTDINGMTPLLLAAGKGCNTIVQILLDKNANIEHISNNDRKAHLPPDWHVDESTNYDNMMRKSLLSDPVGRYMYAKIDSIKYTINDSFSEMFPVGQGTNEYTNKEAGEGGNGENAKGDSDNSTKNSDGKDRVRRWLKLTYGHNECGTTALSEAAISGHIGTVQLLLDKNANLEHETTGGETPLLLATSRGLRNVVRLLLDRGADIEHESRAGMTPLILAARLRRICTVRLLLNRGADLNHRCHDGRTALSWVRKELGEHMRAKGRVEGGWREPH